MHCQVPNDAGLPCGRENWPASGNCIFHMTEEQWEHYAVKSKIVRNLILEVEKSKGNSIDLTGSFFKDVSFTKAIIPDGTRLNFAEGKFKGCEFDGIEFGGVSFRACYLKDTRFKNTQFHGTSVSFDCESIEIEGKYLFDNCSFLSSELFVFKPIYLNSGSPLFNNCYCSELVLNMQDARISAPSIRILITSTDRVRRERDTLTLNNSKGLRFDNLRFNGILEITGDKIQNEAPIEMSFKNLPFGDMQKISLRRLSLDKARFEMSEIAVVKFFNVHWPKKDKRSLLYDELRGTPLNELKRLYDALVIGYDDARDYKLSEDWYYRSQEVSRKAQITGPETLKTSKYFNWATLYKLTSEYGTNPSRTLVGILIANILVFVVVLFIFWVRTPSHWFSFDVFSGIAFYTTVLGFPLRHIPAEITQSIWLKLVYGISILLNTVFVSLFLVSLRRKFRRR